MKVSELAGAELDYWVAKAEGLPLSSEAMQDGHVLVGTGQGDLERFAPSSDWSHGGPIIERERITVAWMARIDDVGESHPAYYGFTTKDQPTNSFFDVDTYGDGVAGETYLIAAMRAYVASKFGDEVDDA